MSSAKKRKRVTSTDKAAKSGNEDGGGDGDGGRFRASVGRIRDEKKGGRQTSAPAARATSSSRDGACPKPRRSEKISIRSSPPPPPSPSTTAAPGATLPLLPAPTPGVVPSSSSLEAASSNNDPPTKSKRRPKRRKAATATISDDGKSSSSSLLLSSGALSDPGPHNDTSTPGEQKVEAVATRAVQKTTTASTAKTGRAKSGAKNKKAKAGAVAAVAGAVTAAAAPAPALGVRQSFVARDPTASSVAADSSHATARKRKQTAAGADAQEEDAPQTLDELGSALAGTQWPRKIARSAAVAVKTPISLLTPPPPASTLDERKRQNRRKIERVERIGSASTSGSEDESKEAREEEEEEEEKERQDEDDDDDDDGGGGGGGVGWGLVEDEGDGDANSRIDGGCGGGGGNERREREEEEAADEGDANASEEEEGVETDEDERTPRVGRGKPRAKKKQAPGTRRVRATTTTTTTTTSARAPAAATAAAARRKKATKAATPAPSILDAAGDAAVERIIALEFAAAARAAVDDDPTRSYDEAYREAVASQTAVNYGLTGNVLLSRMQKYRNKLQQRYAASLVEARLLERVRPGMAQKVVRNAHRMLADRRYAMHPLDDCHYTRPISPSCARSASTSTDTPSPSPSLQPSRRAPAESPISLAALLAATTAAAAAAELRRAAAASEDEGDRRNDPMNAAAAPQNASQKTRGSRTRRPPPTAHVEIGSLPALNKTTGAWGSELFCVRIVARATYRLAAPVPTASANNTKAGAAKDDSDSGGGGDGGGEAEGERGPERKEGERDDDDDDDKKTKRKSNGNGEERRPGAGTTADGDGVDRLRLVVVLHDRDSGPLGVHHIRMYFTWLAAQHVSRVVFLLERPLTPQAMSEAHRLVASMDWNLECEIFKFSDLAFIAVDHDDVPLHETVPPADVRALLADVLRVHPQHLPRLKLSTDPIVKYYGNRVGDILRITGASATNGSRISWCRVVP